MELRWPWVLVVVPIVVLVAVVWWSRRPRRVVPTDALRMAHVARLRSLPRYRQLRRRRLVGAVWLTVGTLLALAGTTLLVARPQEVRTERVERSRDVMLCLDASGSMDPFNERVVAEVRRVLDRLAGARAGLTIFSGGALTIVPLTDDLGAVEDQLVLAQRNFFLEGYDFVAGIDLDSSTRASLLGDGIASCVERFDRLDEDRARSILVTSDNDPAGRPVYSVAEGAELAADKGIVVHAVASPRTADGAATVEFEDAATATGGTFATLGEDGSAEAIVERIEAQEARRTRLPPREVVTDAPGPGTAVAAAGFGVLALGWVAQSARAVRRRRT